MTATQTPLFPPTAPSEALFDTYQHPLPTGTADLARTRDIPVEALSTAYGHVLASNIRKEIPMSVNPQLISTAVRQAVTAENDHVDPVQFEQLLKEIRSASDEKRSPNISDNDLNTFTQSYGRMLGRTVRYAALGLDPDYLCEGLTKRLENDDTPFPMSNQEYDAAFDKLQDCASDVLGTSNTDAADEYFKILREKEITFDLQTDGYIVAVENHQTQLEPPVTKGDSVHIALRVRLLDGRVLVLPTYSDDNKLDFVLLSLKDVPAAFADALVGMREGSSRTIFYHPYAAHEVIGLFVATEFPPQSGLVVDLFLNRILPNSS